MNFSRASFPSLVPMDRQNLSNSELEDDFGAAAVEGSPPHPKVKMRAAGTRNLYHFMTSSSLTCYHPRLWQPWLPLSKNGFLGPRCPGKVPESFCSRT